MVIGLTELFFPLPARIRLHVLFSAYARRTQEFVRDTYDEGWPAPSAIVHVRVEQKTIHVWYGTVIESDAALRWPPVCRSEIGI